VVMTMGALHPGHASLMHHARKRVGQGGEVFVTIFVNPLQFGKDEDFDRYPRTTEEDLAVCAEAGVDSVFLPDVRDIYPKGAIVTIDPGPIGSILEGAARPGHFTGVLTVVNKLLNLSGADIAIFGEKDYQQLVVIQQMVRDLFIPVAIEAAPTVREADGLAMSSRNRYLSPIERERAAAVPKALQAAKAAAPSGAAAAEEAGRALLGATEGLTIDYFTVRSQDLQEPRAGEPGRILAAVQVGNTRIIDNIACVVGAP
jgi:pantoate--beta-alanine ligase